MWSTRYHQKKQYVNYWCVRRIKDGEKGTKFFSKIMTENFPNLGSDLDIQVHEAYRLPNDSTQRSPRYFIIKLSKIKDKERILKTARVKSL